MASNSFALHRACLERNVREVRKLVAKTCKHINSLDDNGCSPLHIACQFDDVRLFEELVNKGASTDLRGQSGYQALHVAASSGSLAVLQKMNLTKANIDEVTNNGETALLLASIEAREHCVRYLLQNGASVYVEDKKERNSIEFVLAKARTNIALALLESLEDYNNTFSGNVTALFLACKYADYDCATFLLDRNADINIVSENGDSPLHMACQNDMVEILDRLMPSGGSGVDIRNNKGETPLHYASAAGMIDSLKKMVEKNVDVHAASIGGIQAIHMAAGNGHLKAMNTLIDYGAKINGATSSGLTPLHFTCIKDSVFCADMLLKRNAEVGETTKEGWTALHTASFYGSTAAAKLLIDKGGDIDVAANDNKTPLHLACEQGNTTCALMLLKAGADPMAKTKEGVTPVHSAAKGGRVTIITELLRMGSTQHVDYFTTTKNDSPASFASSSYLECLKLLLPRSATGSTSENVPAFEYREGQVHHTSEQPIDSNYDSQPVGLYLAILNSPESCRELLVKKLVSDPPQTEFISTFLMTFNCDEGQLSHCSPTNATAKGYQKQATEGADCSTECFKVIPRDSPMEETPKEINAMGKLAPHQRHIHYNINNLAGTINPHKVVSLLHEKGVLSYEFKEHIDTKAIGSVHLSKYLLSCLAKFDKRSVEEIVGILADGGQPEFAKRLNGIISGDEVCNKPAHWEVLRRHQATLLRNLDDISKITSKMLADGVIDDEEYEYINPGKMIERTTQVNRLISIIRRNSEDKFQMFIDILKYYNQSHLAEPLKQSLDMAEPVNIQEYLPVEFPCL